MSQKGASSGSEYTEVGPATSPRIIPYRNKVATFEGWGLELAEHDLLRNQIHVRHPRMLNSTDPRPRGSQADTLYSGTVLALLRLHS